MSILQALVLGLIQGFTEFLPISSSAHLVLVPVLTGWPDQGLVADAAANTGTLLAVLVYFRNDLARYARALLARLAAPSHSMDREESTAWSILLATIPVGLLGLLLQDVVGGAARSPLVVAVGSIVFGVLLWVADRYMAGRRQVAEASWRDWWLVGLAQAVALFPGVSRSGVTMTAAMGLRFDRPAAARMAFLLAVPVGLLVAAKDFFDLARGEVGPIDLVPLAIVVVVSAVVGYLVIDRLLHWLESRSMLVFVVYRVLLGLALLALFLPR